MRTCLPVVDSVTNLHIAVPSSKLGPEVGVPI
jgi:hypothetical protein